MGYYRLHEQLQVNNFQFLFSFLVCSCHDIEKLERGMLRGKLYSLGLSCLNLAQRREGAFVKHFLGTVFRIPDCCTEPVLWIH